MRWAAVDPSSLGRAEVWTGRAAFGLGIGLALAVAGVRAKHTNSPLAFAVFAIVGVLLFLVMTWAAHRHTNDALRGERQAMRVRWWHQRRFEDAGRQIEKKRAKYHACHHRLMGTASRWVGRAERIKVAGESRYAQSHPDQPPVHVPDPLWVAHLRAVAAGHLPPDAETGERYASVPGGTDVADRFVTIAFVGGGETPLRPVVLVDGAQAPAPPDPTVPINTGDRGSTASEALWEAASLAVLAALAAVAFVLARERWLRGLLVGLVAVAAVTALVACSPDETGGRSASTTEVPTSLSPTTAAPTTTTAGPSVEAAADPIGLGIPSIGVLAPIRPTDPADAPRLFHPVLSVDTVGWFIGTSRPGDVGTAVLVGHNSDRPPLSAVFHRLPELVPGAEVVVRDAADAEHRFVVRSAAVWPKGALPPSLYDATPEAMLVLVTCTGEHDPAGGRTHNVVVVATAP